MDACSVFQRRINLKTNTGSTWVLFNLQPSLAVSAFPPVLHVYIFNVVACFYVPKSRSPADYMSTYHMYIYCSFQCSGQYMSVLRWDPLTMSVGDICALSLLEKSNCPMQRLYESHLDRHGVFWNATCPWWLSHPPNSYTSGPPLVPTHPSTPPTHTDTHTSHPPAQDCV